MAAFAWGLGNHRSMRLAPVDISEGSGVQCFQRPAASALARAAAIIRLSRRLPACGSDADLSLTSATAPQFPGTRPAFPPKCSGCPFSSWRPAYSYAGPCHWSVS